MGSSAAVADNEEVLMAGLEVGVNVDLHIIELDLDAVEEGIVVRCTGRDLVKRVDHLDDSVEDSLWDYEGEVAGGRLESGTDEGIRHSLVVRTLTADEVAEALYHNSAAEHIREARDALAVAVRILEGMREMLRNEEGEVGVARVLCGVLVAVAVYGNYAVGVLVNDGSARIHTERADEVAEFLGSVDDLRLVKLVGQMREDLVGKLNANADVNAVRLRGDFKIAADLLHPLTARASRGNDANGSLEGLVLRIHAVAVPDLFNVNRGRAEIEVNRG